MMDRGLERLRSIVDGHSIGPLAMKAGTNEDGYCVRIMANGKAISVVYVGLTTMAEHDNDALLNAIVETVRNQIR